jgi:hypothetical protein
VNDPSGVRWETFYTFADATTYGEDAQPKTQSGRDTAVGSLEACCAAMSRGRGTQE